MSKLQRDTEPVPTKPSLRRLASTFSPRLHPWGGSFSGYLPLVHVGDHLLDVLPAAPVVASEAVGITDPYALLLEPIDLSGEVGAEHLTHRDLFGQAAAERADAVVETVGEIFQWIENPVLSAQALVQKCAPVLSPFFPAVACNSAVKRHIARAVVRSRQRQDLLLMIREAGMENYGRPEGDLNFSFRVDELRPDIPDEAAKGNGKGTQADDESPVASRHGFLPLAMHNPPRDRDQDGRHRDGEQQCHPALGCERQVEEAEQKFVGALPRHGPLHSKCGVARG